ncbi:MULTISPECIES: aminodeoxychorismate synthase component I [Deefgea]|uniref:Aminodeoxychorismate synthase component I n=1 Tax=Deefgea chitinilytica TaxID=570276 RepID=A0ABS2CD29_9NEIS|nr:MULTISPECIES: aminodeoxychorismate synthase component I [Deefgea]MBM5572059.1 aminodeoxychorismate synthase component I [Deefgea chitinilytica]MBM9889294.1 aminodeoxychorismate synthase component I [Deefgea sp. CFH1-16]
MPEFNYFTAVLPSTPDLLALAAQAPQQFPALLQSSQTQGWDILFALPSETRLYAAGDGARLVRDLAELSIDAASAPNKNQLPFDGGWVFYAGYELLEIFEPSVQARTMGEYIDFPLGALIRCPAAILMERETQTTTLLAETPEQLAQLQDLLANLTEWQAQPLQIAAISEDEPQQFLDGVARAKQYIVDGDVFQVNLSRGWDVSLAQGTATDVYAALRIANPAPFSAYLDLGAAGQIVSSSPERLVQVTDGVVQTRPIAGTFARSLDPIEDEALKQRLLNTPKERAEHIMLVDLERNDLGRLAVPGTVKVDELMAVATYSFVHHIESNIRAVLRDGLNAADVLRALFPGGTITGCPKVRCMQIIRELEDRPRLAYTGSLGYINRDGSMDSNILIRTFVQRGEQLYFRAGAGVVADSDAERELQETRHKARGLLRALGVQG